MSSYVPSTGQHMPPTQSHSEEWVYPKGYKRPFHVGTIRHGRTMIESLERSEYEHPHAVKYYVNDALVSNRVTEAKLTYETLPQTLYWDKSKVLFNNAAVFAKDFIPSGTRYGPFKGKLTPYVHRIHGRGKAHLQVHVIYTSTNGSEARPMNVIDGTSLAHCNWMKRVSPAPDPETWNLLAYQHNQNIFFITVKPIEPHQELMFWYCKEYASRLGVQETGRDYQLDLDYSQLANDMNVETCICVNAFYQSANQYGSAAGNKTPPLVNNRPPHQGSNTPPYDSGVDSTQASTPTNKSRCDSSNGTSRSGSCSPPRNLSPVDREDEVEHKGGGGASTTGDHSNRVAQMLSRLVPEGTTITRNDLPEAVLAAQQQHPQLPWNNGIDNMPYRDHRVFAAEALKSFEPHHPPPQQVDQSSDAIDLSVRSSNNGCYAVSEAKPEMEAEEDMEEDTISSCDNDEGHRLQLSSPEVPSPEAQQQVSPDTVSSSGAASAAVGKNSKRVSSKEKRGYKSLPFALPRINGRIVYQCKYCMKVLSQLSNLKVHLRVHTGEKPHKCEECGKAFAQFAHMQKHVLVHTADPVQAKMEFDRQAALRREERLAKKSSPPGQLPQQQAPQPLKHVRSPKAAAAASVVQKVETVLHDPAELRSRLVTNTSPDHELRSRLMDGRQRERKRSTEDLEGAISLASLGGSASTTYTVTAPVADHAAFAREVLTDPSAPAINVQRQGAYQAQPRYEPRHLHHHHPETVVRQPAGHFIAVTGNGYY